MSTKINIGEFWNIIEVHRCVTTKSDKGSKVETYTKVADVHAKIDPTYVEDDSMANLSERETLSMTIYRIKDMTTRWRIRWNGKNYNITNITPISRISPFVMLTAEEIVQ